MKHDVVIPLGTGSVSGNKEIVWAVRSIRKYFTDLGNIFIVGEKPPEECGPVIWIEAKDPYKHCKDANIIHKVKQACLDERLSDGFLFSADDNLLTMPSKWEDFVPRYLRKFDRNDKWYVERGRVWHTRLRDTLLRFDHDAYYWEPHTIVQMDKKKFLECCDWSGYETRTDTIIMSLYFNFVEANPVEKKSKDHAFCSSPKMAAGMFGVSRVLGTAADYASKDNGETDRAIDGKRPEPIQAPIGRTEAIGIDTVKVVERIVTAAVERIMGAMQTRMSEVRFADLVANRVLERLAATGVIPTPVPPAKTKVPAMPEGQSTNQTPVPCKKETAVSDSDTTVLVGGAGHMVPAWCKAWKSSGNTLPVVFYNDGFWTDDEVAAAKEIGKVVDIKDFYTKCVAKTGNSRWAGWCTKQHIMTMCPTKWGVWLDHDMEVRGDLSPIIDDAKASGKWFSSIMYESFTSRYKGTRLCQHGIIVFDSTAPELKQFAEFSEKDPNSNDEQLFLKCFGESKARSMIHDIYRPEWYFSLDVPHDTGTPDVKLLEDCESLTVHWTSKRMKTPMKQHVMATA